MDAEVGVCVGCRDAPPVTVEGFCGHCHWKYRAEFLEGWSRLVRFLGCMAEFSDWCVAHGRDA